MLDERAKLLLKALIERYIADGQPVGSRTLSRASGLELSPATIRNVMADLEDLGLIISPHTSAGRIPTARGYRLFVDTMLTADRADIVTPELVPEQPQKVIANAANLLSSLSQFVGVVLVPRRTSVSSWSLASCTRFHARGGSGVGGGGVGAGGPGRLRLVGVGG